MKTRVCIAGATGWVGKALSLAVARSSDLSLVAAVSRSKAGQTLGEIVGERSIEVKVSGSVSEALATPADVFVDYTKADAVKGHVLAAIERGLHVVIGSSGLGDDDYVQIDNAARARKVGVVAAGNFAITAVLLQRFACEAAKFLKQWEIIDYAPDTKKDAPSGTARELAYRLGQVGAPELTHPVDKTIGPRECRGATMNGMQVHSVRLPGHSVGVEAIFGAPLEKLRIRQEGGGGPDPDIQGTLLALRKVSGRVGLVRGLDHVMGL